MNSLISQAISIAPDIQLIPEILVTPEIEVVDRHVHSIKELLRLTNVERLIYVDDKFDVVQRENEFLGLVKSKKNTGAEFDFIPDIDMIPDPVFEAKMKELWAHSTDRERISFLDGLETKDENTVPIGILNKYFSEVLTTLSPQKWVETKDNLLADIQGDNKVLCLFDSDLGAGERSGQDLARTILTGEHKHKIYCGIFSHIFQPEDENQIRLTYEIDKELFYPISKHRLQSDQGLAGFSQGVKNVLLVRHVENLKKESIKIIDQAQKKVTEQLDNIDPMTFNSAIQKTSDLEGVWEIETLFRLARILSDQETKKAIIEEEVRTKFNESIIQIRNIDKVKIKTEFEFENTHLNQIKESEYFYDGELINQLYYPIKNGDIFKVDNKEYILLSQVCNISLRNNGKRDNNVNSAYIVEIVKCNSLEIKEKKDLYKIRKSDTDTIECARFSKNIITDLDLLDLVVFNSDGRSFINLSANPTDLPDSIHLPWKIRYKEIKKSINKYKEIIVAFNNKLGRANDRDKNILYAALKSPKCMKDLKIDGVNCYNNEDNTFTFPIVRIAHYKEPYSTDLLKEFMNYQARTGFDREFEE